MRLFVGGQAWSVQGEPDDLGGDRCWTAARRFQFRGDLASVRCLLDSGAFSDPPERRPTPEQALERQLAWEQRAAGESDWRAEAVVSLARLIGGTWSDGKRQKRRWTLEAAESAVRETVEAAHFLASQRDRLAPRKLVLACQGVDAAQYADCAAGVLEVAQPGDWLGLGGWCLLGRAKRLLPEFERMIMAGLPVAAGPGVPHGPPFRVLSPSPLR